jgi:pyrroloquinoline quinone (PQQ) biosynthesis protein C
MLTKEKMFSIVGEIWFENSPKLFDFLRNHMSVEGAKVFTLEHSVFANYFPRWFANVIARCPHIDARAYMIENMYVEEVTDPTVKTPHYESLVQFGIALGLTREDFAKYEPMPATIMAINYWDNVGKTKPWLEAFAAICGIEMSNNAELCARHNVEPPVLAKWWKPLGLPPAALTHWKSAEAADPGEEGHGSEPIKILIKYARTPDEEKGVLQALRESFRVKRFRWDIVLDQAIKASIAEKKLAAGAS